MTTGIKDKIVVVTGASSGLGEATARLLSGEARRRRDRASRLRHRAGRIEAHPDVLRPGRRAGQLVRASGLVRDEPARGSRDQRDPLSADEAGTLRPSCR